ncbi:MAG TPA: 23S rRNA pseudouridine(955/2504/2580) synthase RluC [Spongiibacteraceae bacterium]|nr:23S rRNA pseudouridine(955/2504/2580) synthase RluC [Spongiibacteraceae bacterium]
MTEKNVSAGVRIVAIDAGSDGQRVDNFLLRELKGVPKSRVYNLLRRGEVRVNKGRVKAEYRLQSGDLVRIPPLRMAVDESPDLAPSRGLQQRLTSAVLFEDDGLLVLNKPAGLAVHGGSGLSYGLIEALRAMRPEARFLELVHRLDRDTSGCIMVAKKRSALVALHAALRGDGVDKRYLALVAGQWPQRHRRVAAPLEKNTLQSGERMVRVSTSGKEALTEFQIVERFPSATLVEARPITGRTHQIRVHAQYVGHPLACDDKYGNREADARFREQGLRRLFLHAHTLSFDWLGQRLTLKAELEPELSGFLQTLRNLL